MFIGASPNRGFTLIELMIVVAIIGILAVLALPAYQDMTIRARVTEGLQALAPAKTELAETYFLSGEYPTEEVNHVSGGTGMISRVNWSPNRGCLEAWFGSAAGTELEGRILWLCPDADPGNGSVGWTCKGHDGAGGSQWYFPPRYLPSSCRD